MGGHEDNAWCSNVLIVSDHVLQLGFLDRISERVSSKRANAFGGNQRMVVRKIRFSNLGPPIYDPVSPSFEPSFILTMVGNDPSCDTMAS